MEIDVRFNRHHENWVVNFGSKGGFYADEWEQTGGAFVFKMHAEHVGFVLASALPAPDMLAEALRSKPPTDDPVQIPTE